MRTTTTASITLNPCDVNSTRRRVADAQLWLDVADDLATAIETHAVPIDPYTINYAATVQGHARHALRRLGVRSA